ncbi:MAG: NAD(P)/FAD-dependent oxidoreductase [Bacillota bacterium]|uniref:NAD(P)/FAD-dependent oxidoreductase n=1 Tax=Virgibacillus sp. AGTR TaxID=2812055 RepID=UPI001965DDB0|nr:FAD-dependent oxidoreductase [Virgibacillus sp. AGTR]MCC2251827.1 FAD-binding oxidoreductase [Virgibacillus sp. AGTR]QRZ16307.1 FAD-binding oxidoreductase [Virgibacillus sp. AGTR]
MSNRIIIIGGGILGASTAYYLARNKYHVTIIDRFDDGQATDAAAGIVCPWLSQRRNKAWYQLVKAGARSYPNLIHSLYQDGEEDVGYEQVGAIHLHDDDKKLIAMKERAEKRKLAAPEIGEIKLLDQQATTELFPLLNGNYKSVYVSGAARVDGRKLRDALLRAAEKHGAILIKGNAALTYKDNTINGVHVNSQTIPADTVIAATGAWMTELLSPLGVHFQVDEQRAQILHVQLPTGDASNWPVVKPPNNQYMLTFPDNRIVLGATHEDNVGFDHRVTAGGMHEILTKAMEVAPGLEATTILEARVGFRPVTPGFLPVIGPLPGFHGLLLANGLGSTGLTMGPFIGLQLSKLVMKEEVDIHLCDYPVEKAITKN